MCAKFDQMFFKALYNGLDKSSCEYKYLITFLYIFVVVYLTYSALLHNGGAEEFHRCTYTIFRTGKGWYEWRKCHFHFFAFFFGTFIQIFP